MATKISKKYWDSLNEKQKEFLSIYAHSRGVQYCKRILTLAKVFKNWDNLVCADAYLEGIYKIYARNSWIIFNENKMIGLISKTEGYGITERVCKKEPSDFVEIWNNWNTKKPKFNII
jgi:hypothetical protein